METEISVSEADNVDLEGSTTCAGWIKLTVSLSREEVLSACIQLEWSRRVLTARAVAEMMAFFFSAIGYDLFTFVWLILLEKNHMWTNKILYNADIIPLLINQIWTLYNG